MVGVYGNENGDKGLPADVTARSFHEKLLQRLSCYRSQWQDDAFLPALAGAVGDLAAANEGKQPTVAVALVVGHRVATVATRGARLCVFTGSVGGESEVMEVASVDGSTTCYQEVGLDLSSAVSMVLTVGESCLDSQQVVKAAAPHLYQNHCRAANLAIARTVRNLKTAGSIAVACARVAPVVNMDTAPGPAPKGHVLPKVRVQQILVRYWKGTGAKPNDPVRRKQISRTIEEAEMLVLDVLDRLSVGGAVFGTICKSISECQSSLKSRDLAGDLGWLERSKDVALKAARNELVVLEDVVKYVIPDSVLKAASELQVGELSDLVTSDIGIHLLWRTG